MSGDVLEFFMRTYYNVSYMHNAIVRAYHTRQMDQYTGEKLPSHPPTNSLLSRHSTSLCVPLWTPPTAKCDIAADLLYLPTSTKTNSFFSVATPLQIL